MPNIHLQDESHPNELSTLQTPEVSLNPCVPTYIICTFVQMIATDTTWYIHMYLYICVHIWLYFVARRETLRFALHPDQPCAYVETCDKK
jgi:hypothetical protein